MKQENEYKTAHTDINCNFFKLGFLIQQSYYRAIDRKKYVLLVKHAEIGGATPGSRDPDAAWESLLA